MTVTRETTWLSLCLQADPDFARDARVVTEYEFSVGRRLGDERIHRNGRRIFEGDYRNRGPYRVNYTRSITHPSYYIMGF